MNKRFKSLARTLALGSLLGIPALAPLVAQNTDTQGAKPDNTKTNTRDRDPSAVTADQQKENGSDRETARKIRRAIMQDKSLSTYAHNVKIVAHGGTVTLKGPVRSEDEKKTVEAKATEVAGAGKVTNEISVTPKGAGKHGTKKSADAPPPAA